MEAAYQESTTVETRSSVRFISVTQSCPSLCDPMHCSTPGLPVHHQLPESTQTHVHWVSDAMQPSHPLSSISPPALNLSQHESFQMSQLFTSGGQSIGVSASASVLPVNTQDWSPLGWTGWISLQPKGLSRLLQHHSWKASILWCSTFFIVQLSHPYITTYIALTRRTVVGKVMSLLFNVLSRWVISFLPRSKSLLISWLHSPSAVILDPPPKKNKVRNQKTWIPISVPLFASGVTLNMSLNLTELWNSHEENEKIISGPKLMVGL